MDIDHTQQLWLLGKVEYTHEPVRMMAQREVSEENIGEAIMSEQIVEERPDKYPYASCTIRWWATRRGCPFRGSER